MNIIYSSSDSYSLIAGISIISLLENNQSVKELNIYIIDNNISKQNKDKLQQVAHKYGRTLFFIPKPDLTDKAGLDVQVGRWNIGTFFRLFLCSILPTDINRCIYIDCDTIVRHSLEELWDIDLEGKLVAAVDDCRSDLYKTELGIPTDGTYTNNGVMLIDLEGWRQRNVEKDFISYISQRNGDITYVDQGVLNGVLAKDGLIKVIHTKFNAMTVFFDFSFDDLMKIRCPEHHLSREEYNEATSDPYIVHFTSCFLSGTRPWNPVNHHPYTPEYLRYKAMSPWRDCPQYPDDRKAMKKLMTIVCNILPKAIMTKTISFVHSKVYPTIRAHKHNPSK